jgi:hypothetical protein
MPSTYTLISSNVLGSATASVTFSAIPSTYTDLVLRISARSSDAPPAGLKLQLNGSTSSVNTYTEVRGDGSAAASLTAGVSLNYAAAGYVDGSTDTADTFGSAEIYIPSYNSTANKPFSSFSVTEKNATLAYIAATAMLNRLTSGVSSILISSTGATFSSGSSFYLYGISNT